MAADLARARAVLEFWFGVAGSPQHDQPRDNWFRVDAAFDAELRARFLADQQRAAAGNYDRWMESAEACLALILLLDQLPRNLYRGTPAAFACDKKARVAARHAIAQGYDQGLSDVRRWFVYLPFQHSESIDDQRMSLELHRALPANAANDKTRAYAERHHDIIARFGRFPHRNRILGRASTTEEKAFLKEPNSSF